MTTYRVQRVLESDKRRGLRMNRIYRYAVMAVVVLCALSLGGCIFFKGGYSLQDLQRGLFSEQRPDGVAYAEHYVD